MLRRGSLIYIYILMPFVGAGTTGFGRKEKSIRCGIPSKFRSCTALTLFISETCYVCKVAQLSQNSLYEGSQERKAFGISSFLRTKI